MNSLEEEKEGRVTKTGRGTLEEQEKGKYEEETKVRRNLRVYRGVRIISFFVDIISNLGIGTGSDRLSIYLEGHNQQWSQDSNL